jgi:trigger factor
MNITRNDIDELNAEITIAVGPEDYEQRLNEGLKKVQRQASMPGFRPGKVPPGLIRKQYGSQILVDELNKLLNDTIYKYIEEQKLDILGNPLPKDQEKIDFTNQKEFEFVYQLGLVPHFDVTLDKSRKFTYKTVKVDEELITKYMQDLRRNYGNRMLPESVGEKDTVNVDVNELEPSGEIRAGGIYKRTTLQMERMNEKAKAKLAGAKKDDKVVININELYETDLDKSLGLGIEREAASELNCDLQLTIKNISRIEEAELNQQLFDQIYGEGKINGEEEFRNKVREELGLMFRGDSERFFRGEVEEKLTGSVDVKLPDDFLKRWIVATNEKPITEEDLAKEYPSYAKAMKWRLIENKIIKENGIKVSAEEAKDEAKGYIRSEYSRYGQQPSDEDVDKYVSELMGREKEAQKIFENLYSKKVIELVKEKCTVEVNEVSYEEFFGKV